MAGFQLSYDYQNQKRDLSDAFMQVVQESPVLSTLIRVDGVATNTKHEWLEDVVSPMQRTIKAGSPYTIADGAIELTSNVGVKLGDILEFELPTGAMGTLKAKVTAVNVNGETISISIYGGSTDQNMAAGSIVNLLSRPKNEATEASADNGYEPSVEYNYTQIFDRTAKVSLTSIEVPKYGIGGALDYQVSRQLLDIAYEMNRTMIRQARVQRSTSEAGTMGGIMWFLQAATGNSVNASTAAISMGLINDAVEVAKGNGATGLSILLAHPVQARKISAFNQSGNNPVVQRADTTTGSYVTTFVSDQGDVMTLVADRNFDKDKVALLDPSKVALVPLQNRQFQDKDATPAGADYVARRIIGEYTLQVKNAAEAHSYIYGLSI
jgi:hypothetical protein